MKIYLKPDGKLSDCYLRYSDLLDKSDKYDLIIEKKDLTEEILRDHKHILLIHRMDSAGIQGRNFLKHPHVKTMLKMYHYPDLEINNRPAVDGRIFVPFDGTEKPQMPELTSEDMAKIQPGFNFFHYAHMDPFIEFAKSAKLKPINDRKTDLFFAGTVEYNQALPSGRWITKHRKKCVENIIKKGIDGMNVITTNHRAYTQKEYLAITADTKVIMSPYGWGEFCYRDYEALLLGCIVIKPLIGMIARSTQIEHSIWAFSNFDTCGDMAFNKIANLPPKSIKCFMTGIQEKQNEKQIIERILA